MKAYIIAGEASGDLHGSNLIKELRRQSPELEFRGWGGDLMQSAGMHLVKHYRDLAFMGFIEVIMNLRTILRNIDFCKHDIETFQPDVLILIDYPGFNLRIAEWAHDRGIRVFYYISPQVWAWKENRVKKIRSSVDRMYVVLPFEKDFYQKHHYEVEFPGHPLLDAISSRQSDVSAFREKNGLGPKDIIALLPGSRKQEISTMLPLMLSVMDDFPDYQFVIGGAPGQDAAFYRPLIGDRPVKLIFGQTQDLMHYARLGLVTSGTATLEAGLFQLPQVVCYKGNRISYLIARQLIKIRFISLVNLILDREAVRELIQDELNSDQIRKEVHSLLHDQARIDRMKSDYAELYTKLGGPGASQRTATSMLKILQSSR